MDQQPQITLQVPAEPVDQSWSLVTVPTKVGVRVRLHIHDSYGGHAIFLPADAIDKLIDGLRQHQVQARSGLIVAGGQSPNGG